MGVLGIQDICLFYFQGYGILVDIYTEINLNFYQNTENKLKF